jgi:hypothetical protein
MGNILSSSLPCCTSDRALKSEFQYLMLQESRVSSIFSLNMRCSSLFYFLGRKEKDRIIVKINAKKI